ncbi:hypothetical protein E5D57_000009 [Metarhizium anisopliae]|nr:hypothetical protein E5D57_000009 [Metarhizium anisopliae]
METSESEQDSLWGAHGVSGLVTSGNASEFFAEYGLYYQENAAIGASLASLDKEGLSNSTQSFKFLSEHFNSDSRIQPILEPYLRHDNPQICLPFSADPGHIFTFSTAPVIGNRIVVYTLGTGSCIEFYANSHKKDLRGVRASNGLLEIAEASLRKNGCNTIPVRMEKGGMHAFQIREGFTNTYGLEILRHQEVNVSHQ